MYRKSLLLLTANLLGFAALAQQNFIVTPAKPSAGDVITITYTPAGDLANTQKKVEAAIYTSNSGLSRKAEDLILTKTGKKYTATVKTDTADTFLQFGFFVDKKYDTNFGEGYNILLLAGDKIKQGAYANLGMYYQYNAPRTQCEVSTTKALQAFQTEVELYPQSKRTYSFSYYRLLSTEKKNEAPAILQKEIETTLKAGLKTEEDYSFVETLYSIAKLPEQGKLISTVKKEKFPEGKWQVSALMSRFMNETDIEKKKSMLAEIEKNVATKPDWKAYETSLPYYRSSVLSIYAKNKQWDELKKIAAQGKDNKNIASVYNSAAWAMQQKNEDLQLAEGLSEFATNYAKAEWKNPKEKKPDYYTGKQWVNSRENGYAMFADTYAMVMYRLGKYDKGFAVTKEAAITINKGHDPDQNNTYALLAEKILPQAKLKTELEQFVKDGKTTSAIKDILKKIYVAEKKSEEGFDTYVAAIEKESYLEMLAEIKKSMLDVSAKPFSLKDMDGNKISLTDLRGKIVILDFWATWCGPCKASFPGMQKLVTKYKDNPDVKFVFVDTWEKGDNKEKEAKDFMTENKYTFDVLMDNDNEVVEQFEVNGIPTKFLINKEGKIKFKRMGFGGSDDKLISEVTAMIEMLNTPNGSY